MPVDKLDSITVIITDQHPNGLSENFDIIPPVEKTPLPSAITQNGRDLNSARLHREDSIRSIYMATFKDSLWVQSFAAEQVLSPARLLPVFEKAYGNWKEIADFISLTPDTLKEWAIYMLEAITDKDIRDTKAEILNDHLSNSVNYYSPGTDLTKEFFAQYIMSGRIANEMMLPWRGFLQNEFRNEFATLVKADINVLIGWIKTNIRIDNTANMHSRAPLSPRGVFELRVSDSRSRDIFFVAVCRSMGLAARINPATGMPQYYTAGTWMNIAFETVTENITEKGKIHFINSVAGHDPKYAINFTIARYKGGVYRTMDFDYGLKLSEFDTNVEVEAGKYLLVTGNRQPDGSVLSSLTFFEVPPNTITDVKVGIRQDFTPTEPWGRINPSGYKIISYAGNETIRLDHLSSTKGAILIWIDPDKEPSKHVMADIPAIKDLVGKWGGGLVFLFPGDKTSATFTKTSYTELPVQSFFAYDKDAALIREISRLRNRKSMENLPVIVITDAKGNLEYYSEGYKIGVGEQIAKVLIQMK